MNKFLLFSFFVFFISACGQNNKSEIKTSQAKQVSTLGPTITPAIRDELLMRATNIDVVFFSLPISMNQDEKYSVNKTINFIEDNPVKISEKAPAIGRMSILDNGEVLRDIDIHYAQGDLYFTTYENNKPAYYNTISPAGAKFFNNLIRQAGGL